MSGWRPGAKRADTAAMLRVDQAGEYGATRIYAGQLAVLRPNCAEAKLISRMASQEQRHLKRFDRLMSERRVRPTLLQPLWNVAGFALGAATALMSEKAAMACTDAVETEIDRHYGRQLDEIGDDDPELATDIAEFRAEELEHRDTAREAGATQGHRLSALDRGDPCRLQGGDRTCRSEFEEQVGKAVRCNRWRGRHEQVPNLDERRRRSRRDWRLRRPSGAGGRAGRGPTSPRSSSTAAIRARARPTTRSSSAPAGLKPSATAFRRRCGRAARRSRCSPGRCARRTSRPSARRASTAARRSDRPATPAASTKVIQEAKGERKQTADQQTPPQ